MKRFNSIAMAALAVVVAAAYTVLPALPVAAQSSAALSIVPKKNYTIEPGKTTKDKLLIRNLDGEKTLDLSLRVVDFTFSDESGTPKLMLAENAPQTTWSLKPFLKVPKTVKIKPNSSESVDMSVNIPKGQGAGSYYSAIVYSSGTPEGGNVGLSASGVTLVFTSIPGKVKEDLKLEKFGLYNSSTNQYMYATMEEPQTIAYTLKNSGNVTEAPSGSITLKNMFGQERVINDVNPNQSLALIGQTRTYTACIKLKSQDVDFSGTKSKSKACTVAGLWPGYYSASLNLFYGQNGNQTQEIIGAASFWYLPWWFLIIVVVVLAILGYVGWRVTRFVRGKLYGKSTFKKSSRSKKR